MDVVIAIIIIISSLLLGGIGAAISLNVKEDKKDKDK